MGSSSFLFLIFLLVNFSGTIGTGFTQDWIRGEEDEGAHPHDGLELEDGKGFIAVGSKGESQMITKRVDTEGNKVWSVHKGNHLSCGQAVLQIGDKLIVGGGLGRSGGGDMQATLWALDVETGETLWETKLDHSGNGGIRGILLDGDTLVATGYTDGFEGGCLFINDEGTAMLWTFDLEGNVKQSKAIDIDTMAQGARIRADPVNGGYVVASTAWSDRCPDDDQNIRIVKLDSNLEVEWTEEYGECDGSDQLFDFVVDSNGDIVTGGHTVAGVINWDYLALKIDGATHQQVWRHTYGQPRGFDARYIHDECYGVALDADGNYLIIGGSGDEYDYEETNADGWSSDTWVSYLVVISPSGETVFSGVFGDKEGNNAGEYLTVMRSGDVMIYTDSDTVPGAGFLKLTKTY